MLYTANAVDGDNTKMLNAISAAIIDTTINTSVVM